MVHEVGKQHPPFPLLHAQQPAFLVELDGERLLGFRERGMPSAFEGGFVRVVSGCPVRQHNAQAASLPPFFLGRDGAAVRCGNVEDGEVGCKSPDNAGAQDKQADNYFIHDSDSFYAYNSKQIYAFLFEKDNARRQPGVW